MKKRNSPLFPLLRTAFLLTLAVFLLPVLLFSGRVQAAPSPAPTSVTTSPDPAADSTQSEPASAPETPKETPKQEQPTAPVKASASEHSITLRVLVDGKVQKMELEEYLWGVVAAEMPAAFDLEALKAQAIAARTYTLYRMASPSANHPKAHICTDPGCCQAWITYQNRLAAWEKGKREEYAKKVTAAIQETAGQAMYYQDKPIMAAFHAASAGVTKSAETVWGKDLPYLQSVSSPETKQQVPNYYSVVTVQQGQFREALCAAVSGLTLPDDPAQWFGKISYDGGGLPCSIRIGNKTVPTTTLRTLFGLRSASLTAEWDGKVVRFYVTGYGHGVGMSQYGANAMAKNGKTAQKILLHYYTGIKIKKING